MIRSALVLTLVFVFGFFALEMTVASAKEAAGSSDKGSSAKLEKGWESLFDGKTFGKWKANENTDSWKLKEGCLVCQGPRSHLFYTGKPYKNFELKIDVMTKPGSNSGIYFHTKYQDEGWPVYGYESQVNNSQADPVRTGSLYGTVKLLKSEAKDDKWWMQHIIVNGKNITVKIDGKEMINWTEPDDREGKVKLGEGTFALQAHDPDSVVRFKNIRVKRLP